MSNNRKSPSNLVMPKEKVAPSVTIKIKKRFTQQNFYINGQKEQVKENSYYQESRKLSNSRNSQSIVSNLRPNKFIIKANSI